MLTIAWDVDDILNNLMRSWFEKKWLVDNPGCRIKYEDLTQNPPHKILNTTREKYNQSLDAFRLSPDYINMEPNQEILAWFKKHGERARHIALSAVSLNGADLSARWVIKNFGEWIRSFNFLPSKRKSRQIPEYHKSKQEFLKWFGKVDLFIEDNEANTQGLTQQGIKSLLVSQPWNKSKMTINQLLDEVLKSIKE